MKTILLLPLFLCILTKSVNSIYCYQCSSAETMSCSDLIINMPDSPLKPEPCDHVIEAQYCIKSTALNGGIGAKRYCSSKDLGNYCDYVKQRGDTMEYRSCIFTCSTDGCNNTISIQPQLKTIGFLTILTICMKFIIK
ncbi:U-scoloptoxin(05)-Sm1a isoform X2 [Condylostylus longicornis]|uniref:U-scoloptoxin(05)-Sm1a isoform X2 n=1 Tax=Condylostylus longicornis TaxID=2530218 RepID=UPI00244E3F36|nr:U-scoloptoxin(05)-Sm1a isoform X2 [Condylostylus longicornis]